ncbi:MAG: AAA family ATPase [Gemmatimonadales bacterium]
MIPFALTCLGTPGVRGPDGNLLRFRTRKHLALLIVLAVEPSFPHRRDRLATLLWPASSSEGARHSLAVALSVLRSRIGPDAFDAGRNTVRLIGGRVRTDVHDLEHRDAADSAAPPVAPFLDEFDIPDAPDFQQWKDAQQAVLIPVMHRVLSHRIDHARQHGDSRQLETLAQQMLRIDPLTENGVRALMEARAMSGDRIGGIRVFERWQSQLATELGAAPSQSLARMADRLRRRGIERPGGVVLAPVPTEQWQERVFVGRAVAFRACHEAWCSARNGTPRHVLVRGESGIGKTTLVERVVTALALEGATVARLQCYALERELPFGTAGTLVTHLLDLPGASATAPEHLAELSRIVPKVRQRFPALPAPQPSVGEGARIRFTEAVMALIAAIADEHPVVLVVDDIALADATSLAVLHLILRRICDLPFMMILTSSSSLDAESPNARRFVDNAASIGLVQVMLTPMSPGECTAVLDALVGRGPEPGSTIRRAILAGAGGNPMILELLMADWQRRGADCLAITLGSMTSRPDRPPAEAFQRLVDRSLAALDGESRAVAELGALLGKRMNDLSMYTLIDLPVARTMRAMTTLTAHRVLRDAGHRLEFANECVRGQCYVSMAEPLRRLLHAMVADRLVVQDGGAEPIPGLEIAWHLVRADRLADAIPYLLAGGRESIRRGGPHEADLALSTGLPALTGEARRGAILLLAEALQELGRWDESLRVLDGGDAGFSESEECCRTVLRIVARRWLGRLSHEELLSNTECLIGIVTSQQMMPAVRVLACSASIRLIGLTQDPAHMAQLENAVHGLRHTILDIYERLHVLLADAWLRGARRELPAALRTLEEAICLAVSSASASSLVVRLHLGKGNLLCLLGLYDKALEPLNCAEVMAKRLDNPALRAECTSQLALAEGRLGNAAGQVTRAREALQLFPTVEWSAVAVGAAHELGLGLCAEGRHAEAEMLITEMKAQRPKNPPAWLGQASLLGDADILWLCGRSKRAIVMGRAGTTGQFEGLHNIAYAGMYARWRALVAIADEKVPQALADLTQTFPDPRLLDPKDEAEVLASLVLLESREGIRSARRQALQARISSLPLGASAVAAKLVVDVM